MRHLFDYLPDFFENIEEFVEIFRVLQSEIDVLSESRSKILDNLFIETADEDGLAKYEQIYSVEDKRWLSNEERRYILNTVTLDKRPVTYQFLCKQIGTLCQEGGYFVDISPLNYTIRVKISISEKSKYQAVKELLNKIIPANMILSIEILYNRYSMVSDFTFAQLQGAKYKNIKEDSLSDI